jgi:hypothetical protein
MPGAYCLEAMKRRFVGVDHRLAIQCKVAAAFETLRKTPLTLT